MSEEKLALTNEQLGRLFREIQVMRATENGEEPHDFEFTTVSDEELEMFYGYVCGYSAFIGTKRQSQFRELVKETVKKICEMEPRPTKQEAIGIAYCIRRAIENSVRYSFR